MQRYILLSVAAPFVFKTGEQKKVKIERNEAIRKWNVQGLHVPGISLLDSLNISYYAEMWNILSMNCAIRRDKITS